MSYLDLNMDDVFEPSVHDADQEVRMRITSAKLGSKKDDSAAQRIEVVLSDPADDTVSDIYLYLSLPKSDLDRKKANAMKIRIRDFITCFSLSTDLDIERDYPGKEGWVVVGLEDSPEFGKRNTVRRFCNSH
jgi:hypothetical protein